MSGETSKYPLGQRQARPTEPRSTHSDFGSHLIPLYEHSTVVTNLKIELIRLDGNGLFCVWNW